MRVQNDDPITSIDMFELGLSGTPNAKQNKKKLLKSLDLPEFLSTSSLISYLNSIMNKMNFINIVILFLLIFNDNLTPLLCAAGQGIFVS